MKKELLKTFLGFIVASILLFLGMVGKDAMPARAQTNFRETTTILVYDTSSSMDGADVSGLTKISAAINAGQSILSIIDAEVQANLGQQNEIGIVQFSDDAGIVTELTTDMDTIQAGLASLYASGGTALPSGLYLALEMANNAAASPVIILLSDGRPTRGLNGEGNDDLIRQQTFDLASDAGSKGICIYTIGFGIPESGSIDEAFLQEIASRSGCGKYYNAQNAADLQNVFVLTRHESLGNVRYQGQGEIAQDEQITISTVDIPAGEKSMIYSVEWHGSKLEPTLFDPNGTQVDSSYPGATFTSTSTLATIIVQDPIAGQWQFGAIGVDVPEGILTYSAALSTRTAVLGAAPVEPVRPYPDYRHLGSGWGVLPFMVVIVLASVVLIFYLKTQRGKTGAYLQVVNDPSTSRIIMLKNDFVLGRNPGSSLRLADNTTSRQHARITYNNGVWFIQDMGSAGGTFVNGQRTQAARLNHGDQIKVGQAAFVFRVQ